MNVNSKRFIEVPEVADIINCLTPISIQVLVFGYVLPSSFFFHENEFFRWLNVNDSFNPIISNADAISRLNMSNILYVSRAKLYFEWLESEPLLLVVL